MIPLAEPILDGNELRYLEECVKTGYVSSVGAFVERFERDFAESLGANHAVGCSSGTAALHVALRLAGAGQGKLVAVSDFTFIASANAASYTGADLLLVDSEPGTWNMNTAMLRDEVVHRARLGRPLPDVIEVVHVLGHPARMEPLLEVRDRFGIPLVEDAAESLGASWRTGEQVGTVGQFGCFSFNGNKIITSGGGGMIVTNDAALSANARHLTTQARRPGLHYGHDTIGYNYRLTNIAAAVGAAQLERLPEKLAAKRAIAAGYTARLREREVSPPPHEPWASPSYWLYSVLLGAAGPTPDEVVNAMAARDVQVRPLWPPLHLQEPYRHTERLGGSVAEEIYRRGLSLPSSPHLTEEQQELVCEAFFAALR